MISSRRARLSLFIFSILCGALLLVIAIRAGEVGRGVFALLWVGGFGALLFFARGERTELLAGTGDERAQRIDGEALRYAHYAVIVVAVIGFVVEWARSTPGPFTLICFVGGTVHMASVLYLRNRR